MEVLLRGERQQDVIFSEGNTLYCHFCSRCTGNIRRVNILLNLVSDFHRTQPYVVTGSVDKTVKVWECR